MALSPEEQKIWDEYGPKVEAARVAENEALEAAFVVGAPEFVDGVPIRNMTLAEWMLLSISGNVFIVGGQITEKDVFEMMWILSLGYEPKNEKKRDAMFVALMKNHNVNAIAEGITQMIDRMMLASPLGAPDQKKDPLKVGFAATIIHRIASSYHWTRSQIMDTPMRELFQYLRMIDMDDYAKAGKDYPQLGGASDRLFMEALAKMEEAKKKKPEASNGL